MEEFLVSLQIRDSRAHRGPSVQSEPITSSIPTEGNLDGSKTVHCSQQSWLADRLTKIHDEVGHADLHHSRTDTAADELNVEKERFLLKQVSELQRDKLKLLKQLEHLEKSSEEKNKAIQKVQDENIQLELERQVMEDKWKLAEKHLADLELEHKQLEMRWIDRINSDSAIYTAKLNKSSSAVSPSSLDKQTAPIIADLEKEIPDDHQLPKSSILSLFGNPLKSSAFRSVGRSTDHDV